MNILKFIIYLYFILQSLSSIAQTSVYHPFPLNNSQWCCRYLFSFPPDCYYGYTTYKTDGTIIINDLEYTRIIVRDSAAHYLCSQLQYLNSIVASEMMFIRQDTALKIVYKFQEFTQSDEVLYNFNLNVGDTLNPSKVFFANDMFEYKIVSSIDSVLINGNYRKRYNYNNGCSVFETDSSIIEGIGALHGFIYPPSCFESYYFLDALRINDELIYGDSLAFCYDVTTNLNHKNQDEIFVFPNPVSEVINIKGVPLTADLIILYDTVGKVILEQPCNSFTDIQIDLKNIENGIYIMALKGSGFIANKIIIKN